MKAIRSITFNQLPSAAFVRTDANQFAGGFQFAYRSLNCAFGLA